MTGNTSSTAGATSEIAKKLQAALAKETAARSAQRIEKIAAAASKFDDLARRGLISRQNYGATTASEFEKQYLAKKV